MPNRLSGKDFNEKSMLDGYDYLYLIFNRGFQ